ncbi:acyltransferase family protein [Microbacterium amylolyticum]|uniref:Membrane protein YcfT n=1 Tax=Microbacterium amylolyticum TaxID=936337 RepID=A0ABS4ZIG3_9MICO|nr:acyltransferase family protein [Microbacterium amylolyticum]MBP2437062.1 putative membrane protein YcfT [Microbacterium amylolyticum]
MTRITTSRYAWVDAARAFAIVLVVLDHSLNWLTPVGLTAPWWHDMKHLFTSMRMPLLFTVSGIFAIKWVAAPWHSLLTKKVQFFIWIFLIWAAIGALVLPLGEAVQGNDRTLISRIGVFVLAPVRPTGELWFIWALVLYFIAVRLMCRVPIAVQLVLASVIGVVGWVLPVINVGWSGAPKYFFFFLVGIYLREKIFRLQGQLAGPWGAVAFGSWAVLAVVVWRVANNSPWVGLLSVLGVVAGIAIAGQLARVPMIHQVGQSTLPIYLAHTPIIILVVWALWKLNFEVIDWMPVIFPFGVAIIAIAGSLGLERVVRNSPFKYIFEMPPVLGRLPFGSIGRS